MLEDDILYKQQYHINSLIGKRGKKDATSNYRKEQLKEFRYRWYEESTSIQKVVELERMSQKPPDLWDLYLSHKFTNFEIDWLYNNDILRWLSDGPIFSNNRPIVDTSKEPWNVIRICPQNQKSESIGVAA